MKNNGLKKTLLAGAMALGGLLTAAAGDVPVYPGGQEAMNAFIKENLKYPQMAKDNGIEGNVNLQLIVKADGTITSIKVVRMIDPDLEAEAIRLVKMMPAWTPADKDGKPVDATVDITVPFRLD